MYGEKITIHDKEIFNEVIDSILSVLGDDALKIILYGSVARGDNTPESDVDIAVITTTPHDWRDREKVIDAVYSLNLKYDTLFSVLLIDSYKFFVRKYEIPFYRNVNKEGIILWKNHRA